MNSAVFLDRDGVIIENRDTYVRSWEDVEFLPLSIQALKRLSQSSFKIVIITNQSAIGRGIITSAQADKINRRILERITDGGGRVDGIFVCPHSPLDQCQCRKPLPGLILQAAEELAIDLSSSVLIGDALTDLQAGQAAGIPTLIMVKSGRGQEQLQLQLSQKMAGPRFLIADHLFSALDLILTKPDY